MLCSRCGVQQHLEDSREQLSLLTRTQADSANKPYKTEKDPCMGDICLVGSKAAVLNLWVE